MRKSLLFAAVLAAGFAAASFAQDALSINTRIASADGAWFVVLSERPNKTVQMTMTKTAGEEAAWAAWIDWRSKAVGYVANDGGAFVVVESEYSDEGTPITVFTKGKREAYSAKALPIAREFLLLQANKLYWIDPAPDNVTFVYDAAGRAVAVDLRMINEKLIRVRVSQPDLATQ
jgi:hypothetical protein